MSLNKYLLIRPSTDVDEALKAAASKRRVHKIALIERLLTVIVTDNLVDAVLDDVGGSDGWHRNERSRSPN
jgi:hypothetical protein